MRRPSSSRFDERRACAPRDVTPAGFGNGTQPCPRSAARRIAAVLLPPTQIGGCGCCGVSGRIVVPRVRKLRPSTSISPSVQIAAHHVDRLVGELVALVEVDAQRGELGLEVAGRDPEDHAPARQHVEAQHRLRGQERVAVRQHEDVRLHAQPGGRRGRERQRDERVERVVPAACEPLDVGRGMVGDEARVEAGVLGRAPRTPSPPRR